MKQLFVGVGIVGALVVSVFGASLVAADSKALTKEQLETIQRNCQTTKVTLNRLHASDALLRVNRGQVYEAVSLRLMNPFNARLANNNLNNKALVTVGGTYRSTLDSFRINYRLYEEKLSEAIKIDCHSNPQQFHDTLEVARERRKAVHKDVEKLHQVVDDYQRTLDDFKADFMRRSE